MTENELKKTIAIYKKTLEVTADNGETCFQELDKNTLLFLEELEQYRAIGLTPKMVKEMVESEKLASHQAIIRGAKLEKYEAIGTIEELQELKEKLEKIKFIINEKNYSDAEECDYGNYYTCKNALMINDIEEILET